MRIAAELRGRVASEVIFPRLGELRVCDLGAVYGAGLLGMEQVDALVLSIDGAVAARVTLGRLRSGSRVHAGLVCDGCANVVRLLAVRDSELRCRRCLNLRTERQRARTTADWYRRGGRETDQLLRLLASPTRHLTSRRLRDARRLAQQIVDTDRARVARIKEDLQALRRVATR